MSFSEFFKQANVPSPLVRKFAKLLEPTIDLETMAEEARRLTRQHFGRTMRLFAPLYVSNECINNCLYCGFSRNQNIRRLTLTPEEVDQEARYLYEQGFRSILLVSGEHPKRVSVDYLQTCIRKLHSYTPSVSLEVAPMEVSEYRPLVQAGAEGLVLYQETYHQPTYQKLHPAGPKKNFAWRLDCPERAGQAGFKRIGIGVLLGLCDWREDAVNLAAHAEYLLKKCWKSFLTISLPRLRPAEGGFQPRFEISDREYVQLLCAFRVCFPQIGLVLSTRESPPLRDGLMDLGITLMSASAKTNPGGYACFPEPHEAGEWEISGEQFAISDQRSVAQVANRLREKGLDPVWKDWDQVLC